MQEFLTIIRVIAIVSIDLCLVYLLFIFMLMTGGIYSKRVLDCFIPPKQRSSRPDYNKFEDLVKSRDEVISLILVLLLFVMLLIRGF